jgi:hypothetical protein
LRGHEACPEPLAGDLRDERGVEVARMRAIQAWQRHTVPGAPPLGRMVVSPPGSCSAGACGRYVLDGAAASSAAADKEELLSIVRCGGSSRGGACWTLLPVDHKGGDGLDLAARHLARCRDACG